MFRVRTYICDILHGANSPPVASRALCLSLRLHRLAIKYKYSYNEQLSEFTGESSKAGAVARSAAASHVLCNSALPV